MAKWENALDERKLAAVLSGGDEALADDPEDALIDEEAAGDAK